MPALELSHMLQLHFASNTRVFLSLFPVSGLYLAQNAEGKGHD